MSNPKSNPKSNLKNIFLSKYKHHSFSKNSGATKMSLDTNADDAQKWLEKFRPDMQSINKPDAKITLPRFVQDFIYEVWCTDNEEVYEKPQKKTKHKSQHKRDGNKSKRKYLRAKNNEDRKILLKCHETMIEIVRIALHRDFEPIHISQNLRKRKYLI